MDFHCHVSLLEGTHLKNCCFRSKCLLQLICFSNAWRFDVRLVSRARAFAESKALLNCSLACSTASIPGKVQSVEPIAKCNIKGWSENKHNKIITSYCQDFSTFRGLFSKSSVLVDALHHTEVTSAWLDLSASFTSANTLATWVDWYHKTRDQQVGEVI